MATPPALTPAQRTREALLDAGERLAETDGFPGMTVSRITAAAGVAKGTFYLHFEDRDAYMRALHVRFYLRIQAAIAEARESAQPGEDAAWRSLETYLDACLHNRAIRVLLLEAWNAGALAEAVEERRRAFLDDAEPVLAGLGYPHPRAAARLVLAMVSDVALAEMEAGRPDREARGALRAFLRGGGRAT